MFTYERHLVVMLVIAVVIIAAAVLAAVLGVAAARLGWFDDSKGENPGP